MNAVVHCHDAGLFSLINKVMVCLGMYERVHVDFSQGCRCLYGPRGVNLWNYLFEATEPVEGVAVVDYPDHSITSNVVSSLYGSNGWRIRYNELWNKVKVHSDIIKCVDDFVAQWGSRHIVSVLVRSHAHAHEQETPHSQTLEEYALAIEQARRLDSVLHVMAPDEETIAWFRKRFYNVTCYPFTRRNATRDKDFHLDGQSIVDAKLCLVEVLILARSNVLIHPVSNMATAALYINPKMEGVYLE